MSGHRYNNSWYSEYLSPPPAQLCFVLVVLLSLLGFSWYINYESVYEDVMDQVKIMLMVFPVIILLALHCLSSDRYPLAIPLPEQDYIHRAGGSPWGVGLLLLFLMYMISFQTSFQERWFPLLARR